MKRILVTGATGFVGRRLCRVLLERGDAVVAVVRKSSPTDGLPAGIEYYRVDDVGPQTTWNKGVLRSVDVVVHLAGRGHTAEDRSAAEGELRSLHVDGTRRLLEATADRVDRFVHVSAAEAVRTDCDETLTEDSECAPDHVFGRTKLGGEQVVRGIAEATRTETVILRPAPIYGPERLGHLEALFNSVQSGKLLPFGLVSSRRSLLFVDNFVDALVCSIDHPAAAGETFLLADGEDVSLKDIVRLIGGLTGGRRWMLPVPVGLVKLGGLLSGKRRNVAELLGSLTVDISRIRQRLNWEPPIPFNVALEIAAEPRTQRRAA